MKRPSRGDSFLYSAHFLLRSTLKLVSAHIRNQTTLAVFLLFVGLFSSTLLVESKSDARGTLAPRENPVSSDSHNSHAQTSMPSSCCGKKPAFTDPAYSSVFTGQVAITTSLAGPGTGYVLEVIDLKNQSTAPLNSNYAPPMYHGPAGGEWTKSRLGHVFGLTLDNLGNIYTTATTAYNGDYFPTGAMLSPPVSAATGGEVYKIDRLTGIISVFQTLPNPGHAGLGNINFDCEHKNFYVSNIDDGLIYRLDSSGSVLSTWDHGANLPTATPSSAAIPDISTQMFTPLGRRIWGIQAYNGRLYYAVWWEDQGNPNATHNTEVWSIALDATTGVNYGNFVGTANLEFSLPPLYGTNSMPISDISFGPAGTMLVTERSMTNETSTTAHVSRVLEYAPGTSWTLPNPTKFKCNPNRPWSAAGGVDYDFTSGGLVWTSGDALHYPTPPSTPVENDYVYGIEGIPTAGGDTHVSVLIDLDTITTSGYKMGLGDVEIPCPPPSCTAEFSSTTACPGRTTTFVDLSSGATSWNWSFGDGGTSTLQSPVHVYSATGTYFVTLTVNGGECEETHTVIVPFDCFSSTAFDDDKARLDNFAIELHRTPDAIGYVVIWGGRNSRPDRAAYLGRRTRSYLVMKRGIDTNRLVIIDGGRRETDYIELSVLPRGVQPPQTGMK